MEKTLRDDLATAIEEALLDRIRSDATDNKALEIATRYLEKTGYVPGVRADAASFSNLREAADRRKVPFPKLAE